MKFDDFSIHLEKIEQVSSRLKMTEFLAELYQQLQPGERAIATYLMQGQLVPDYESLEFQLSEKMLIRALAKFVPAQGTQGNLFGEDDQAVRLEFIQKKYKELGDLGQVAAELLPEITSASLDLQVVFDNLVAIARASGTGSQETKLKLVAELLGKLAPRSAKYVIRIILGKMRLGFSKMTLLDALSWAMTGDKSEHEVLELAYQKRADVGALAELYLPLTDQAERLQALTNIEVEWGVPVVPALCQRLNTATEVIEKMQTVYAEPKYDGMRVQVHIRRHQTGQVELKVFTRNLENIAHMFPEFAELASLMRADSAVFDGEVIGINPTTGELLPFQETITRRRKHHVAEQSAMVPVKLFIFDLLMEEKISLVHEKLRTRKDRLKDSFKQNEQFVQTKYILTSDPQEIRTFHSEQLGSGLEGVVIKQQDAVYQSGRKGWSWVKMKEAEGTTGKLNDTLDLIVMGYYRGRGKRAGFGLGAFLVGVLSDDQTVIKTMSKIGTGLTDQQFAELKKKADQLETPEKPKLYDVPKSLVPDVWLQPGLVVEIAADEMTRSPLHSAGLALRFPRLVQFRADKSWQEATTLAELANLKIA